MKPEDIIKATRNSLNIYSFTGEALEKLIAAIQSEHKCQTCEALARTVMMDQTAHDTIAPAAQRQPLTDEQVRDLWSWSASVEAERTATTQQHAFARAIEAAHGITGEKPDAA